MLSQLTGDTAAMLRAALRHAGYDTADDEPVDPMVTAALPVVRQLVLHGMLLPASRAQP